MNKIIKMVKKQELKKYEKECLENIFFCFVKSKEKLIYLINYINIKPFKKLKKGEYSAFNDYLIEFGGIDDLALINYKITNPRNIKTCIKSKGEYFYFSDINKDRKISHYLIPFKLYKKTFKLLDDFIDYHHKLNYLPSKVVALQEQIELFLEPYKITSIYDYIFTKPQLLKARK